MRVLPDTEILASALDAFEHSKFEMVVVVDKSEKFVGLLTTNDARRALERPDIATDCPLASYFFRDNMTLTVNKFTAQDIVNRTPWFQNIIPILDERGHIQEYIFRPDPEFEKMKMAPMLIMAGGFGRRMGNYTKDLPKPLLKLGDKRLIDHVIDNAIKCGVNMFYVSVHHFADQIESYLGNGKDRNIKIEYLREQTPRGTGGCFGEIPETEGPVLVANSDILCELDLRRFLYSHIKNSAQASLCTKQHIIQNPFGVVESLNSEVSALIEKPQWRSMVNAGIYIVNAEFKSLIGKNESIGMPDFLARLIAIKKRVVSYPLLEKWSDLGIPQDYEALIKQQ